MNDLTEIASSSNRVRNLPVTVDLDRFIAVVVPGEYHMEFKAYSISGHACGPSGQYDIPLFERKEGHGTTEQISEAQVFVSGEIKWDGCINYQFDEQEDCMLHACV